MAKNDPVVPVENLRTAIGPVDTVRALQVDLQMRLLQGVTPEDIAALKASVFKAAVDGNHKDRELALKMLSNGSPTAVPPGGVNQAMIIHQPSSGQRTISELRKDLARIIFAKGPTSADELSTLTATPILRIAEALSKKEWFAQTRDGWNVTSIGVEQSKESDNG